MSHWTLGHKEKRPLSVSRLPSHFHNSACPSIAHSQIDFIANMSASCAVDAQSQSSSLFLGRLDDSESTMIVHEVNATAHVFANLGYHDDDMASRGQPRTADVRGILRREPRYSFDHCTRYDADWGIPLLITTTLLVSRFFPSWLFFYMTSTCFIYGLLILTETSPVDDVPPPTTERIRKVNFQEGTKFHRLPRPLSRRQKQEFIRKRFEIPKIRNRRRRRQATPSFQSDYDSNISISSTDSKLIQQRASDETSNSTMPRMTSENDYTAASPSKLVGGDSPMARLRGLAASSKSPLRENSSMINGFKYSRSPVTCSNIAADQMPRL